MEHYRVVRAYRICNLSTDLRRLENLIVNTVQVKAAQICSSNNFNLSGSKPLKISMV